MLVGSDSVDPDIVLVFIESKEWRGVVWEDAETEEGVQSDRHHSRDDQEERKVEEGTAAPDTRGGGEKVRMGEGGELTRLLLSETEVLSLEGFILIV